MCFTFLYSLFLENFALINIYRVMFEILVQVQVGLHENCRVLVFGFNQNWKVCKFQ
jgi:hypothetical protein